jgi:hypothetical protein
MLQEPKFYVCVCPESNFLLLSHSAVTSQAIKRRMRCVDQLYKNDISRTVSKSRVTFLEILQTFIIYTAILVLSPVTVKRIGRLSGMAAG